MPGILSDAMKPMQRDLPLTGTAPEKDAPSHQGAVPGVWSAAAVAALFALGCASWLISGAANTSASTDSNGVIASELAEVSSQDIHAALATMDGSPAFLGQFRQRAQECARPLAWVSLQRAPGQPPSEVRLQSGSYFSPVYNLLDAPIRVAIPFPAPYEMGQGNLVAFDLGGTALIALSPTWKVSPQSGGTTRTVMWRPDKHC